MLGLQINQAKSRSSYHPKPKIWKHYQTLRLWAIIIIFLMFTWWLGPQTCHRVVICHFSKLLKAKHFSLSSTIPDPKKNLTAAALVVEAQEFLLEFSKGESWSSFFGHDHIRCWWPVAQSVIHHFRRKQSQAKTDTLLAWKGFIHEFGWCKAHKGIPTSKGGPTLKKTHFDTTCLFVVFINNNI